MKESIKSALGVHKRQTSNSAAMAWHPKRLGEGNEKSRWFSYQLHLPGAGWQHGHGPGWELCVYAQSWHWSWSRG